MRLVLGVCACLLVGCYCSHRPTDGGPMDAGADAGHDAGRDAGPPWRPPPGVCAPPPEYSFDRFAMDTQALRDQQHANEALLSECNSGEACTMVHFTVGADGRIDSTVPDMSTSQECADRTLLGLCVPTFIDSEGDAQGCGI